MAAIPSSSVNADALVVVADQQPHAPVHTHPTDNHQHHSQSTVSDRASISRRDWLRRAAVVTGGVLIGGGTLERSHQLAEQKQHKKKKSKLAPFNLTAVAKETTINVTMECRTVCVSLDRNTFQKKRTLRLPSWFPAALVPPPVVIKDIPNSELLTAAIVAGSAMEMFRTSILYPILTLKARVQSDINTRTRYRQRRWHPKRRLKLLQAKARRHWREGQLYAGVVPSLLVSVPATGVYYGVRDVVKRVLLPTPLSPLTVSVAAAFCADVVSLMARTPADTLALRLQVATGAESHANVTDSNEAEAEVEAMVGNWFTESLERVPAVILTDLPYLLSRIALNQALIQGEIDIAHYELTAICTALLCGFLTTPFDVARTRILVDSDSDPRNGIDGGSGEGLLRTFQTIMKEGDGGVANLFAGWLERTLYLGIARAWLEPVQVLGYTLIRDAILLEWFD